MIDHPPRVVETRRRATGIKLNKVADSLDTMQVLYLGSELEVDAVYLSSKELEGIATLCEHLGKVEEQLKKMAVRLGVPA